MAISLANRFTTVLNNLEGEVARLMRERVRDTDSTGRWGGEEFMLLIPETEYEGAALLAEGLRLSVEKNHFQHGGQQALVTLTLEKVRVTGLAQKSSQ